MGAAAEANLPVFPDRRLGVHGILQGVGLQASLERRAVRAPAGRPGGHPGGEWHASSPWVVGMGGGGVVCWLEPCIQKMIYQ